MSEWVPREFTLQAASLTPEMHNVLIDGKRFNFKFGPEDGPKRLFSARAEQADNLGEIRIVDIRDERPAII